jgi:predicted O-methyltransferase YrrM
MDWNEYVDQIDDSHQMTTDKSHIRKLCNLVHSFTYKILELGSHRGISTAGLALASPSSTIDSVDLCDTIKEDVRVDYWKSLGITNIAPFGCSAEQFLNQNTKHYDFIFHDAVHGSRAMNEYIKCASICDILAIHDFEQLSILEQDTVSSRFKYHLIDTDTKGRMLFIGFKK